MTSITVKNMPVTVRNKSDSGLVLLRLVTMREKEVYAPFAWPADEVTLEPRTLHYCLLRVPLVEPSSGGNLVSLSTDGAREAVPVAETIGKGLNGYIINSKGSGANINGRDILAGTEEEDEGIIFIAT